jgi:hypothetical protein
MRSLEKIQNQFSQNSVTSIAFAPFLMAKGEILCLVDSIIVVNDLIKRYELIVHNHPSP